jgi:hypothetical protein
MGFLWKVAHYDRPTQIYYNLFLDAIIQIFSVIKLFPPQGKCFNFIKGF